MNWNILVFFAVPALFAWLVTPLVIRIARPLGAIDLPNERKVHTHPMPRLGGLAIFLSFFLSLLLLSLAGPEFRPLAALGTWKGGMLLSAILTVLVLGVADDIKPLSPAPKFLVQVIAAGLLYAGGFRISSMTGLFDFEPVSIGLLDLPVTILWIVGVTNAFNLIDGLDGLAAGVGTIASLTIFAISFINGDIVSSLIILTLAGALTGFLKHNFNPARIFLGDSGSLLIGLLLAVFSIESSTKGSTAFAIAVPMLALGLPIMDTIIAMIRRILRSLLPGENNSGSTMGKLASMFFPDRRHIHHQLVSLGLSHRKVVILLYLFSCLFGVGAFTITITNNLGASLVLGCVALATVAGIRQLRYREMAILQNGILLPIYDRPLLNRSMFQGFVDLALIATSFLAAYFISPPDDLAGRTYPGFRAMLPVVCGVQLSLFYLFGLYRGTVRVVGVGDFLHILKAVTFTGILGGAILLFLPATSPFVSFQFLILDYYFLLSLVVLVRISFPVLHYLFRRNRDGDQPVLIYGATSGGLILLQKILDTPSLRFNPLGFIDDNPGLHGKYVNGYPVFGGHWILPALLRKLHIGQILLTDDPMKSENFLRLQEIASDHGIHLKRPVFLMEDVPVQSRRATRPRFIDRTDLEVAVTTQ